MADPNRERLESAVRLLVPVRTVVGSGARMAAKWRTTGVRWNAPDVPCSYDGRRHPAPGTGGRLRVSLIDTVRGPIYRSPAG